MNQYRVKLTGRTPLLMFADSVSWGDRLKAYRDNPENKDAGVSGDDRSPAWSWVGRVYHDGGMVCLPADNLMTVLREGGAKCPTGKGKTTFKKLTQSGLIVDQASWPLIVNGQPLAYGPIGALIGEGDFAAHQAAAEDMGFTLFVKRCRPQANTKHVRVRPRFDTWSAEGTITVLDTIITQPVLSMIVAYAGKYCGLCDWRPSSPRSPGKFGMFETEIKPIA